MTVVVPAVLREVHWTDIPALAGLEAELFPGDAWSVLSWWAELAGRPRRDYVALVDELGIVAYGGLDHGGEVADIMTVAVAPRSQRRGLGHELVAELERRAASRGAAYLMLEVRADNIAAIGLYERHGFEVATVRRRYYQPGDVDALVLRKTLQDKGSHHD